MALSIESIIEKESSIGSEPNDGLRLSIEEMCDTLDIINERLSSVEAKSEALNVLDERLKGKGDGIRLSEEAADGFQSHLTMYMNLHDQRRVVRIHQEAFHDVTVSDAREYIQQSQEDNRSMVSKLWSTFVEWVVKIGRWLGDTFAKVVAKFSDDTTHDDARVKINDASKMDSSVHDAAKFLAIFAKTLRGVTGGSGEKLMIQTADNIKQIKAVVKLTNEKFEGKWGDYKKRVKPILQHMRDLRHANSDLEKAVNKFESVVSKAGDSWLKLNAGFLKAARQVISNGLNLEMAVLKEINRIKQDGLKQAQKGSA